MGGILTMDLSTLVKMSNTYGSNPAYVLAGGGNTSVKDDTTLYVKGSGTQLATIKAEEFVEMSRARLNEIMKTDQKSKNLCAAFQSSLIYHQRQIHLQRCFPLKRSN